MVKNRLFVFIISIVFVVSCSSVKQANNFKDCTYSFASIEDLKVGNIDIQGKKSFRDLNMSETTGISQLLMAKKLPISLTANISITNPNSKTASIDVLEWILLIKDKEIAKGIINNKIEVKPNQTINIPIPISTDIGTVLKAFSLSEITHIMFNISDISGIPVEAKLKVKPAIRVGKKEIKSPSFFIINVPTK